MAQVATLEGLRDQINTSVHGRRLGLDANDYLVGVKEVRKPIKAFTAISGTLNAYGINSIGVSTAAAGYTMPYPVTGSRATLVFNTTAVTTLSVTITASTLSYFQTTVSSTNQTITVSTATANYIGQTLTLIGLSTSIWFVEKGLSASQVAS